MTATMMEKKVNSFRSANVFKIIIISNQYFRLIIMPLTFKSMTKAYFVEFVTFVENELLLKAIELGLDKIINIEIMLLNKHNFKINIY